VQGIFGLAEKPSASEEEFFSMELVRQLMFKQLYFR
jgi:hypothetical protein